MSTRIAKSPTPIRMLFELERADNPRLYDDLIRFTKGTKRVNRLRTLAHEGLIVQHWPIGAAGRLIEPGVGSRLAGAGEALITNQVFDEPIIE